ncbi:hypothetical protein V6615_16395 (plasmid) [Oscillospiraceae bacterium PP1C4]
MDALNEWFESTLESLTQEERTRVKLMISYYFESSENLAIFIMLDRKCGGHIAVGKEWSVDLLSSIERLQQQGIQLTVCLNFWNTVFQGLLENTHQGLKEALQFNSEIQQMSLSCMERLKSEGIPIKGWGLMEIPGIYEESTTLCFNNQATHNYIMFDYYHQKKEAVPVYLDEQSSTVNSKSATEAIKQWKMFFTQNGDSYGNEMQLISGALRLRSQSPAHRSGCAEGDFELQKEKTKWKE